MFFGKLSRNIRWKKKIKKLLGIKGAKKLTNSQKKEIKDFYRGFIARNVSYKWHQFYFSCTGIFSPKYVPENLFYMLIEPTLNRMEYFPALADKNLLNKIFPKIITPVTVVRNINGFYVFNKEYITEEEVLQKCKDRNFMVIKPTLETGGGKNVKLFRNDGFSIAEKEERIIELLKEYKKDFIIQEIVEQHPEMRSLNETSLNTFRIMTYLKDTEVVVLSSLIRIGKKGSFTDNAATGGISSGVGEDGRLNEIGYHSKSGEKILQTDSGIEFKNVKLDFADKVAQTAKELHKHSPQFRLISWDLAVTPFEEVVLVEYNVSGQDINLHQLNNGPVFSVLLEEL